MRLGGVSQKIVALARRKADGIVEGDGKKEGRAKERTGPNLPAFIKPLDPTHRCPTFIKPSTRTIERVDRWAEQGAIPPSFVAPQSDG